MCKQANTFFGKMAVKMMYLSITAQNCCIYLLEGEMNRDKYSQEFSGLFIIFFTVCADFRFEKQQLVETRLLNRVHGDFFLMFLGFSTPQIQHYSARDIFGTRMLFSITVKYFLNADGVVIA